MVTWWARNSFFVLTTEHENYLAYIKNDCSRRNNTSKITTKSYPKVEQGKARSCNARPGLITSTETPPNYAMQYAQERYKLFFLFFAIFTDGKTKNLQGCLYSLSLSMLIYFLSLYILLLSCSAIPLPAHWTLFLTQCSRPEVSSLIQIMQAIYNWQNNVQEPRSRRHILPIGGLS